MKLGRFLSSVAIAGLLLAGGARADDVPDLTARLEFLGNPGKQSYPEGSRAYARNVWDLQAFNGRIYVGLGNSANEGPAPNAGPIDIWAFDPSASRFVKEATVEDEQVAFRVIDGELIALGIDPREDWSLGNFYRRTAGGWAKVRTLPNAVHNLDMVSFGDRLWAATATEWGAVVSESSDGGRSWREHRIRANVSPFWSRALSFFVHADRLYVFTSGKGGTQVFALEEGTFRTESSIDFFPGVWRADRYAFMTAARSHVFGRATLYLSPVVVVGVPSAPDWFYVLDEKRRAHRVHPVDPACRDLRAISRLRTMSPMSWLRVCYDREKRRRVSIAASILSIGRCYSQSSHRRSCDLSISWTETFTLVWARSIQTCGPKPAISIV